MTAALKMAAKGELCSQIKKLMVFCKDTARSIKGMRQHLAVTQSVMDELLKQALEQKLLWKQINGMYKTVNTKMALIDAEQLPPNTGSLLDLAQQDEGQPGGALDAAWSASCAATDFDTAAAEANTLEQISKLQAEPDTDVVDVDALVEKGLVKADGESYSINQLDDLADQFNLARQKAAEKQQQQAALDAELTALAELLDPDQLPVIDDIDSKQHALAGIALLLKTRTPALANLAEQLATDLSVIRLHQERRA